MSVTERAADLAAEQEHFRGLVANLPAEEWQRATPAERWTIHDQVAHVVLVEELAATAVTDPAAFAAVAAEASADGVGFEARLEQRGRDLAPAELLTRWAAARPQVLDGVRALGDDARVGWFGPPMRPASFLAARLMETWAHGQDVRDALGVPAPDVARLRTIADLGVRTRGWSYVVRGLEPDRTPFTVRLDGPAGVVWTWGEGPLGLTGSARDFCAVVTQRRHWTRCALRAHLAAAADWMEIAQAFAGPPTVTSPDRAVRATTPGKPLREDCK